MVYSKVNKKHNVGDFWGISSINKATTQDHNNIMPFKFVINGDKTVVYNGVFDCSKVTYGDRYTSKLNAVEMNSYISILDLRKIVRDHPDFTLLQLHRLLFSLEYICNQALLSGLIDLSGYILNGWTTKKQPEVISYPEFPEGPDEEKDRKTEADVRALLTIGSIFVTDDVVDC